MKRPTAFCAGPTARRGCIQSLQTSEASEALGSGGGRLPHPPFHDAPPHPFPLPLRGGEGRGEVDSRSWPQLTSKFWRCSLSMNRPSPCPLPALRGEGRERGANLVHGPNACGKTKGG